MIRALLFDLDDTLYREADFVASGFRAVAERMAAICRVPSEEIHRQMMDTLAGGGRRKVMPDVLERYPGSGFGLTDLVGIYRGHTPAIRLFTGYGQLLARLRESYRLGIVTDGTPEVQKSKCAALGLKRAVPFCMTHS